MGINQSNTVSGKRSEGGQIGTYLQSYHMRDCSGRAARKKPEASTGYRVRLCFKNKTKNRKHAKIKAMKLEAARS